MVLFGVIAAVTLAGSVAALSLRNLVHCALALALALSGLAVLYLQLGAQFVGFAQVLVYVGAVAILIVFAILLTRGVDEDESGGWAAIENSPSAIPGPQETSDKGQLPTPNKKPKAWTGWLSGLAVAGIVFALLATIILRSRALSLPATTVPAAPVRRIGEELMTNYVLPLEVLGLLLTAALIGAVIIALREPEPAK